MARHTNVSMALGLKNLVNRNVVMSGSECSEEMIVLGLETAA
jgi:hypothetical protein